MRNGRSIYTLLVAAVFLLALNLLVVKASTAQVQTDPIINEIMQNPSAVGDSAGEWFELFNPTGSDIDIDGWAITDDGIDSHVITNGGPLLIPAGGFLVLGNNSDTATNGGVTVDYDYGSDWFLSNSSDEIVLLDTGLLEIDRVAYDGGPAFPDPNGASMALTDPALDNNIGANWCTSGTPFGAGDLGTPGAVNDCGSVITLVCGDPATFIHAIQGSGPTSPEVGNSHEIEGVVVGDFQGSDKLSGFFVQEEDADADADPMTSEGIFIFDGGFGVDVNIGDVVRVQGTVAEFFGLTELTGVGGVAICGTGTATAATVTLPVAAVEDWEYTEGMLMNIPQILYTTGNFNLGRFGEVDLSAISPLDTPTNVVMPGTAANDLQDLNDRSRIQLDDGSSLQNPLPLPPYVGPDNTLRTGDTIPGLTGVLGFAFGSYEIHPTGPVSFTRTNPRPTSPPSVGGSLTLASFNVLNYFTTIDTGPDICGPLGNQGCRGADSAVEFTRQRDKIISAIASMDADIVGLVELENAPDDTPIADLVSGINDLLGAGTYGHVATGAIGTDAIRVGFIYKPGSVTPMGDFAVLDSSVNPLFDDTRNRPALAQTFMENATAAQFTAVVNHLKSKGSPCDIAGDPDTGDGQGNCNITRTNAAAALRDWLLSDPTASGDSDFLVMGDLNAYAQEDPITTLEAAGYTDLIETNVRMGWTSGAYSFNFFSQSGYLHHGLSNSSLTPQVAGAAFWHINADEPRALDYNDFNQPDLYNADPYRASDHDPLLVGLYLNSPPDCSNAGPSFEMLWPPNHKFAAVDILGVTDPDGNPFTIIIDSIFQDEAVDARGSGNTSPDGRGVGTSTAEVRAERTGRGNGRVYHISFTADDGIGGACSGEVLVSVPINRDKKGSPIDDGPLYDSTITP